MRLQKPSFLLVGLLAALYAAGCSPEPSGTRAPGGAEKRDAEPDSLWGKLTSLFSREMATLPLGTEIRIRLEEPVSSTQNTSGDKFRARLTDPIEAEGKLLAPTGTEVTGQLLHVVGSDPVKGRAEVRMILRELRIDGEAFSIETQPLILRAESTVKKDAMIIGGSSAVGSIVGAVTGGKKGAAIGAGVGAGGGTGYVLATKGEEVELQAGTLFKFALSKPVSLPVRDAR